MIPVYDHPILDTCRYIDLYLNSLLTLHLEFTRRVWIVHSMDMHMSYASGVYSIWHDGDLYTAESYDELESMFKSTHPEYVQTHIIWMSCALQNDDTILNIEDLEDIFEAVDLFVNIS